MEVNYQQVFRVLLNNRLASYRPDRKTIDSLVFHLPEARILGFGYYDYYKLWYLLVYSPTFPTNPFAATSNLTWFDATGTKPMTTTKGWEPVRL